MRWNPAGVTDAVSGMTLALLVSGLGGACLFGWWAYGTWVLAPLAAVLLAGGTTGAVWSTRSVVQLAPPHGMSSKALRHAIEDASQRPVGVCTRCRIVVPVCAPTWRCGSCTTGESSYIIESDDDAALIEV